MRQEPSVGSNMRLIGWHWQERQWTSYLTYPGTWSSAV